MKPSQRDPKPLSCLLLGKGTDPRSEAHGATPSILPPTPGASPLGSPWPSPPAGRSGSALPTAESHQTLLCCGRSACRVLCLCASLCVYWFFIFFLEDFGMNPAGILTFPQRFPHLEAFFIFFFPLPSCSVGSANRAGRLGSSLVTLPAPNFWGIIIFQRLLYNGRGSLQGFHRPSPAPRVLVWARLRQRGCAWGCREQTGSTRRLWVKKKKKW